MRELKNAETIDRHIANHRDELAALEAEWAQAQANYERRKATLRRKISDLRAQRAAKPRKATSLDPHVQAGHANIAAATDAFSTLGRATMAEIGAETGIGSGTLTWTIRALEKDGVIRETGNSVRRSREYEYVARRGRVSTALPGS